MTFLVTDGLQYLTVLYIATHTDWFNAKTVCTLANWPSKDLYHFHDDGRARGDMTCPLPGHRKFFQSLCLWWLAKDQQVKGKQQVTLVRWRTVRRSVANDLSNQSANCLLSLDQYKKAMLCSAMHSSAAARSSNVAVKLGPLS